MSRTLRTVAALIAAAGLTLGTSAAVAPAALANTGCCLKK